MNIRFQIHFLTFGLGAYQSSIDYKIGLCCSKNSKNACPMHWTRLTLNIIMMKYIQYSPWCNTIHSIKCGIRLFWDEITYFLIYTIFSSVQFFYHMNLLKIMIWLKRVSEPDLMYQIWLPQHLNKLLNIGRYKLRQVTKWNCPFTVLNHFICFRNCF